MKAVAAFLLALVAVNALGPLTKQQHMDVLAEIHAHPLGEAIFSQISLTMSAQGYLGDIVDMVAAVLVDLEASQETCDANHAAFRAVCDRLLPQYAASIVSNSDAADVCDQTVADTEDLLADAEDQLAQTVAELASVQHRLDTGQGQRDGEHAAWETLDAQHTAGVSACQDAVNLVASLSRGSLFIQLQGRIKSVTTRLEEMTHLNDKFTAYAPLINSFSQIASSSSNPALLNQISGLITTLRNQISSTQEADAAWEAQQEALWQQELLDLTAQKDSLNERRANLENNISNYNHIIQEQTAASVSHRAQVDKFTYLLAAQTTMCEEEQVAYTLETSRRDAERDVLNQLHDYISGRMSSVEEFIMMKQTQ